MARTSVATDDFNRASLGSNWSQLNAALAGNVVTTGSTQVTGSFATQPTNQISAVRWVGAGSFTNDQYSVLKLTNAAASLGSTIRAGVVVRASGSDSSRTYYEAVVFQAGTTELNKWVSGTRTNLHSASVTWANNDTIELEAEGTTIRVLKNGSALGGSFTQTDSSITTGAPGFATTASFTCDDWEGGNLSSVSDLTGSITLDNIAPGGELGLNPSGLTGSLTLDAIAPTGTLGIAPGSVTTLPFSRNTGSRPTGISGVALAVLSDDANLTRLAGATSLSQDGSGRINYTGAGLPSVGTSVLVVTREADGRLGLERYTVQ